MGMLRGSATVSGTVFLLRYSVTSRNTTNEPLAEDDNAKLGRVGRDLLQVSSANTSGRRKLRILFRYSGCA